MWAEIDSTRMLFRDARIREPRLVDKILAERIGAGFVHDADSLWSGHALLLVGYDNHGFLFKNSWGTDWGDEGYAYMSYDFHRLFAMEILAISRLSYRPLIYPEIQNQHPELRLKSLPEQEGEHKKLLLSVINLNPLSTSDYDVVDYEIVLSGGGIPVKMEPAVELHYADRGHSAEYPLIFLGASLSFDVTVTYKYGGGIHKRHFSDVTWANREYAGSPVGS